MPILHIQIPPVPYYMPAILIRLCITLLLRYRKIRYGYEFRRIRLTQGKYAIVDVEDFEKLNKDKWYLFENKNKNNFYAVRTEGRRNIFMHRRIMNAPQGAIVDHINRNGLDNRRTNLRIVNNMQNCWNSERGFYNGASKYKGVRLDKRTGKWYARIRHNGKEINLGSFDTEIEAAIAYDNAAKALCGQFAVLNRDIFGPLVPQKPEKNLLKALKNLYILLFTLKSRV
ncbi:MAG: AP2 domain-containing protein [Phycisphaerae bacterium]|nr:AP2 domain-containing protein [Phycisphaerae bacterium]